MRLRYHPAATNEALDAASHYEQQRPGLGRRFEQALEAANRAIAEAPTRWPRHMGRTRRYRLKDFPYGVVYRIETDAIGVFAVMHLKRRQGYWLHRLRS